MASAIAASAFVSPIVHHEVFVAIRAGLDNVVFLVYTLVMDILDLPQPLEFEWDEANKNKIWLKHKVSSEECEEAFATEYLFKQPDELHSDKENRHILVSKTKKARFLFIVYTLRKNKVRVVSARGMHKKELGFYEKEAHSAKV
jgi:uncharacterized DUF497 family protein